MGYVITDSYPDPDRDGVGDCIAFLHGEVNREDCECGCLWSQRTCKHCLALDEWFKRFLECATTRRVGE